MNNINLSEVKNDIVDFLSETFPLFDATAPDDVPFPEHGVDSLGTALIVMHLEQHYQIEVLDSELTRANLGSLRALLRYISQKTNNGN